MPAIGIRLRHRGTAKAGSRAAPLPASERLHPSACCRCCHLGTTWRSSPICRRNLACWGPSKGSASWCGRGPAARPPSVTVRVPALDRATAQGRASHGRVPGDQCGTGDRHPRARRSRTRSASWSRRRPAGISRRSTRPRDGRSTSISRGRSQACFTASARRLPRHSGGNEDLADRAERRPFPLHKRAVPWSCLLAVGERPAPAWVAPLPAPSITRRGFRTSVRLLFAHHRSLTGRMAGVADDTGSPTRSPPERPGNHVFLRRCGGHGGCVRHTGQTRPTPGHTEGTSTDLPGLQSEMAHT